MKERIKRLFCRHKLNQIICWHYTHGPIDNEFTHIEAQVQCHRCGKYRIILVRDPEDVKYFEENHKDKFWSATC